MGVNLAFFIELFFHVMGMWWVIVPSIFLGLVVGAIPGFSAANTIIILLPFTFMMEVEVGLVFMIALYWGQLALRQPRLTAIQWQKRG
jgi:putative tricarboxylic transport membrane protein